MRSKFILIFLSEGDKYVGASNLFKTHEDAHVAALDQLETMYPDHFIDFAQDHLGDYGYAFNEETEEIMYLIRIHEIE